MRCWSSTNLQESPGVRSVCRTGSQVYARNKPTTAVRAFFPGLFRREMAGEIAAALLRVATVDRVSIVRRTLPTRVRNLCSSMATTTRSLRVRERDRRPSHITLHDSCGVSVDTVRARTKFTKYKTFNFYTRYVCTHNAFFIDLMVRTL